MPYVQIGIVAGEQPQVSMVEGGGDPFIRVEFTQPHSLSSTVFFLPGRGAESATWARILAARLESAASDVDVWLKEHAAAREVVR